MLWRVKLTWALALGCVLGLAGSASQADSLLKNPSFETPALPEAWDLMSFGPAPAVVHEHEVTRDGRRALRISATEPTLAAVSQLVAVEPGKAYVLKGWVRTESLEPTHEANMLGTLLVMAVGETDSAKMAKASNQRGTVDWTPVQVAFTGPEHGRVFVFCSFCGERTATGKVWFDGLELYEGSVPAAATQPESATQPAVTQPAAETQPVGRPIMRLRNGSFEGAGLPDGWGLLVLGPSPLISQDYQTHKEGSCAVRVHAAEPTMGVVSQTVRVEPGRPYRLRGWLRTEGLEPQEGAGLYGTLVVVAVDDKTSERLATGPDHRGTTEWTQVDLAFTGPPGGVVHVFCSLCGEGQATGTVWFDGLELAPAPATQPASAPAASQPTSRPGAEK